MTLRSGREFLAIPGPTTVPDEVLAAMHRPAIDVYGDELIGMTDTCLAGLGRIFRTEGAVYIYPANGHGGWEAALTNCCSRGDKVLIVNSGMFAEAWGEMAQVLGIEVEVLEAPPRRAVDPQALLERLRADRAGELKAILAVQIDTAAGVVNDVPAMARAVEAEGHRALLMVDVVASLGCMPFEMDAWGVDVAVGGSQKGLMSPPGLAFIAASERARAVHRGADLVTRYWDWTFREGDEHYQKYCGTAPEHMLFGLRRALELILEEGMENVFRRHALLADATRAAVAQWAEGGAVEFNVLEASERANSLTTVRFNGFDARELSAFCRDHCGVVLGYGIGGGGMGERAMRIAHMGHVNAPTMLGTLGVIETGLVALGIPQGSRSGVAAAAATLGEALAPARPRSMAAAG